MKLMGFYGSAGSGKNTAGEVVKQIAAEQGKLVGSWAFGHPVKAEVYARQLVSASLEEVFDLKPPDVRKALQVHGTLNGRHKYGWDLWVYHAEAYVKVLKEGIPNLSGIVFTDLRFHNEVDFIRWGGRICLEEMERVNAAVSEELVYDEDSNRYLEEGDIDSLLRLEEKYAERYNALLEERFQSQRGYALKIDSDRTSLEGELKAHESENQEVAPGEFDGIIVNNKNTTLEELREQLTPWVERLFVD